jgi:hypothetical protein
MFTALPRSTLCQSYVYAQALSAVTSWRPHWGVIRDEDTAIGLVQYFTARLAGGMLESIALDRGPLWFSGAPTFRQQEGFWQAWRAAHPRRMGRWRRLIPEIPDGGVINTNDMAAWGLVVHPTLAPYRTIWLDIDATSQAQEARLSKTWRHDWRRSLQSTMTVVVGDDRAALQPVLAAIAADHIARGLRYDQRLMAALARAALVAGDTWVIKAVDDGGRPLAAAWFIRHGQCATWQGGYVSAEGRRVLANYRVLMAAIDQARARGIRALDLGGVNDQDAKGVLHFKSGLGGRDETLVGTFC